MGDSSPKSKNKQKQQDNIKKKQGVADAAAKQAPAAPALPSGPARKAGK